MIEKAGGINKFDGYSRDVEKPAPVQEQEEPKDQVSLMSAPAIKVLKEEDLRSLIHDIPKVDLHRHLEGCIDPKTFQSIAKRRGLQIPGNGEDGVKSFIQVNGEDKSLIDFLKKLTNATQAFTDKDAVSEITYEAIKSASEDNVKFLELRYSPETVANTHKLRYEEDVMEGIMDGAQKAQADFGIDVKHTILISRRKSLETGEKLEKIAEKYKDRGVVGIDLGSDEYNFPAPGPFGPVFARAKENGLGVTVHAGENAKPGDGAKNVMASLEHLYADRIGHGVRATEDPQVVEELKRRGTVVEMCPTSNVQTGAAESLEKHPIKEFMDRGIKVSIGSDDPSISNTTLTDEYMMVFKEFGFSLKDLETFIDNGIQGAFLPQEKKDAMSVDFNREIKEKELKYLAKAGHDTALLASCFSAGTIAGAAMHGLIGETLRDSLLAEKGESKEPGS
jgi:adenosine deaminase